MSHAGWWTIRRFRTERFRVDLQWTYDEDADPESYDAATRAGIERGDYASYEFRVVVRLDGHEVGTDYLGDSIYSDPAEFGREHLGIRARERAAGVSYCCYFPDMLRSAIGDARRMLQNVPRMRRVAP